MKPNPRRPRLVHPDPADLSLTSVLHALSDSTRLTIVRTLDRSAEKACGTFPVDVAPSTLTHHFRILREAGLIRQREEGARRWTTLRAEDVNGRFPGLLAVILASDSESRAGERFEGSV